MDTVRIRPVTAADAAGLLGIYAPYVRETTISFEHEAPDVAAFSERIAAVAAVYPWLVCEVEGRIAAYAYACRHMERPAYAWDVQTSVYAAPAWQGRGLGRRLYACLFDLLRELGYINAYAIVVVPDSGSLGFHTAQGFSLVGTFRHTGYKFGAWRDTVWLEKTLTVPPAVPAPPRPIDVLAEDFVAEICRLHAEERR